MTTDDISSSKEWNKLYHAHVGFQSLRFITQVRQNHPSLSNETSSQKWCNTSQLSAALI